MGRRGTGGEAEEGTGGGEGTRGKREEGTANSRSRVRKGVEEQARGKEARLGKGGATGAAVQS
jgi:hypothetical protein